MTQINKYDKIMMKTAFNWAEMSSCKRKKVGAILSSPEGRILATGYNGTIKGQDNNCEEKIKCPECDNGYKILTETAKISCVNCDKTGGITKTKTEVLHAEQNLITYCAREGISMKNNIVYATLSPCITCAKLLAQTGIKEFIYSEEYKDISGLELLKKASIKVRQLN
jgi:dCMP deaminase